jgi:hypothetical protein
MLDGLHRRPTLKKLLTALPPFLWKHPQEYGLVQRYSPEGSATSTLHDSQKKVFSVSSAVVHEGWLYLGSPRMHELARIRLRDWQSAAAASPVAPSGSSADDTHLELFE